ncbi:L-amino-acid oxidase [Sodiomyces alkalinus F11]|uniref:L-amino-acid oxidase n=1 Tax=Sodiomyces alkalinus (strain CBS 110278 / VKM F-3762 / F11) TaxID=1314773 RepID=A0A3N2PYS6_SODAK|nr:L-amino-acid oxidase [Sodiomyces alkalinus F11]ROT39642.1 L-amino-acid oxidase [Sodiomyces alkalinus F11]
MARWLLPIVAAGAAAVSAAPAPSDLPVKLETRSQTRSRVANVHVTLERQVDGPLSFAYGPCAANELRDVHHTVVESEVEDGQRLVWLVPEDADSNGCLTAWSRDGTLVGRSEPQLLEHRWKRRLRRRGGGDAGDNDNDNDNNDGPESIQMNNETGIDPYGAWFQGVKLLAHKQPKPVHVAQAKAKEIAIVGAGMSGLMSWLVLRQAGMTNLTLLEGSERLGGRVRTEYLSGGPFDYSYQEMGPMRFPHVYHDPETGEAANITDQQIVYQLADELNALNGRDPAFNIDWITWVESQPNALMYYNDFKLCSTGLPPTRAQIQANASLGPPPNVLPPSAQGLRAEVNSYLPGLEFTRKLAHNIFAAHSEWIRTGLNGLGGDVWSEFAFMVNHLGGSLADTSALGGFRSSTYFSSLYNLMYFYYGTWRTIDGGLNRLPNAFGPLLEAAEAEGTSATRFGVRVEEVRFDEEAERVELAWRDSYLGDEWYAESYDYAVVAAPFSSVRTWRLPALQGPIAAAISSLPYEAACKVALEFSERFWEDYANPIYGGCGTSTDQPGIGSVCYPSYDINGTGPASLLASYVTGDWGVRWLGRTEEEHVKYVLDEMVEIHGEHTRELYTGNYRRKCWAADPLGSGWASPSVGMHQLFMPAYFETHKNMIFVGEHTGVTHAWIAPAVETGLRGAVQLLLELGLVDEAKEAVDKWAGRWIDI